MIDPSSGLPRARRGSLVVLLGLVVASGYFLYFPTLSAAWAYDDIDHLNAAADVLAGRSGYWEFMFRPHLEHLVPVVRVLFHANLKWFGVDAFPFRLVVVLAHLVSAVLLGLTVRSYTRSGAAGVAGVAAGLAYVVPAGFSSMWIWIPTGAGVPFGMVGITGALAALAHRSVLGVRNARILAAAGGLFALFCENSLAPLLACPALLDEYERRREGRSGFVGPLTAFLFLLAAGWSLLSMAVYSRLAGEHFSFDVSHGVPRAVFLLAVAPFRYFFPGLPLSYPGEPPRDAGIIGTLLGLVVAAVVGAAVLALSGGKRSPLATVAALTAVGPIGVIALVGLRRSHLTYGELYDADRYFFTLLIPVALLAGAIADGVRDAASGWSRGRRMLATLLLAVGFAAELLAHRSALFRRFPRAVFDQHERRFDQLERLADRLNETARSLPAGHAPLLFPDGDIWFADVHNGRLSARLLMFAIDRSRPEALRLGTPTPGSENERVLNAVFRDWEREVGEPSPYLTVEKGVLVNARGIGNVDFRGNPMEAAVVDGFHPWEGWGRWMSGRGELRLLTMSSGLSLLLAAPMKQIRAAHPDWDALEVRAVVVDESTGQTFPLGSVRVVDNAVRQHRLDAADLVRRLGNVQPVRVRLECDRVWRPIDVLPGSKDTRELTVQVFQVAFL